MPVLILVVIAIPSFRLVYYEDRTANADLTIKVTGHQWYWEYNYPDNGEVDFTSYMIADDELKPGPASAARRRQPARGAGRQEHPHPHHQRRRDPQLLHPGLGVQRYAIPGRTIETWVRVDKPGDYYGECNQICGTNHSRMPIAVAAVSGARIQRLGRAGQDQVRRTRRRRAATRPRSRRAVAQDPALTRMAAREETDDVGCDARRPRHTTITPTIPASRALAVQHEPQGYRHALPDLRGVRRPGRRRPV